MASVDDAEVLWRRVPPLERNEDGSAKSSAFKTQALCVHRAVLVTLEALSTKYPSDHIYEFTVADAKRAGASHVDDALEEGDAPEHAVVYGTTRGKVARNLRDLARRVHPRPE